MKLHALSKNLEKMEQNTKNSNIFLGTALSISEVIFTTIITGLVKFIAGESSVFMILFFRYLFCIPLLLFFAIIQRGRDTFLIKSTIGLAIRTITGLATFGTLFAALQFIDLSLMTTLLQTIPLFVTIFAPILIKEVVGWFRRAIALVGFIGIILLLNPENGGWLNIGIILGLAYPFFGALMLIFFKKTRPDRSSYKYCFMA